MAKQIIVQRVAAGPGGDRHVSFLFWLQVAAGREIPITGGVSQWAGASAAENAAIAAGSVVEEAGSTQYQMAAGKAAIQADLLTRFTARQAEVTARPNPNQFLGVFLDSLTGWSA